MEADPILPLLSIGPRQFQRLRIAVVGDYRPTFQTLRDERCMTAQPGRTVQVDPVWPDLQKIQRFVGHHRYVHTPLLPFSFYAGVGTRIFSFFPIPARFSFNTSSFGDTFEAARRSS